MASREDADSARAISLDVSRPNTARVYDCLLGGKDNFAADRAEAEQLLRACPQLPGLAWENRRFLARAATWLAARGIRQFMDIGCGFPAAWNIHEAVRTVDQSCRVLYADSDPMVVRHCTARLSAAGVEAIQADLADSVGIFSHHAVRKLIRAAEPTGLVLGTVLQYFDAAAAEKTVAELTGWLAPGSYVVISVWSAGKHADEALTSRGTAIPFSSFSPQQVTEFFAGLDLAPPGLVDARDWFPGPPGQRAAGNRQITVLAGVGRKPARDPHGDVR